MPQFWNNGLLCKQSQAWMNRFCSYWYLLYIVESEILKNTQWDIFHIFTSEDIDHVLC
jgi:hypothetical protein